MGMWGLKQGQILRVSRRVEAAALSLSSFSSMVGAGEERKLRPDYAEDRFTPLLLFSCTVASCGGLLYGYELGISGGVTSMESFLGEFFPGLHSEMNQGGKISNYCKFNSQLLTLFTSSLYIAGLFASLFASHATARYGRRVSMRVGGTFVFAGAIIGGAAMNFFMLIFSRILMGFGVGFTNQSISLYLSEVAPARYRGAIFNFYDLCLSGSILTANIVNYFTQKIEGGWGWRISLGAAALPAAFLAAGSFFIPETPTSVIQRGGDLHEASLLLQQIRGTANVDEEFDQLVTAATEARIVASIGMSPLGRLLRRNYRPQLVMTVALPIFQQLVGINLVGLYSPLMFQAIGQKESTSLLSTVVIRLTGTATNLVATPLVDRLGRRTFFFVGGLELLFSLVAAGSIMAAQLGDHGPMSGDYARLILAMFCLFLSGFAWSWGPLPMLVTSEILPLEIRSAGRSIAVAAGLLFTALMAQSVLFILCHLKWGLFFLLGGCMLVMTLFVFFFLPETKGLKLEEMEMAWKEHWYWKRFVGEDEELDQSLLNAFD